MRRGWRQREAVGLQRSKRRLVSPEIAAARQAHLLGVSVEELAVTAPVVETDTETETEVSAEAETESTEEANAETTEEAAKAITETPAAKPRPRAKGK